MSIIDNGQSSTQTTYKFDVDTLKRLMANDLQVQVSQVHINFVMGNLGPSDPMDRYDPPRGVVAIEVTVKS